MAKPDRNKPVPTATIFVIINGVKKKAILADSNCEAAFAVLSTGVGALAAHPAPGSKVDAAHIKSFVDAVASAGSTDEHGFLAFGLSDDELRKLTQLFDADWHSGRERG